VLEVEEEKEEVWGRGGLLLLLQRARLAWIRNETK
jgi:hypothetical protein